MTPSCFLLTYSICHKDFSRSVLYLTKTKFAVILLTKYSQIPQIKKKKTLQLEDLKDGIHIIRFIRYQLYSKIFSYLDYPKSKAL
ncbi:MAG: hypothetical protein AAGJ08_28600 [Cyanobacteria bacterium P01_H01_bin.35]